MTIHEQVISFINSSRPELFASISIDVFRHQYVAVPAYRKYCDAAGIDPNAVSLPDEIPMVSTVAFKFAELCPPDSDRIPGARVFLTSGTTVGRDRRGRHVVAHPEVYRASALAHLRRMMFPDGGGIRMLALHPTADRMPESSLSAMISWCIEEFGGGLASCAADRSGLDCDTAVRFLREAQRDGAPVCILATTAAIAALFEHLRSRQEAVVLPAGSRMMDTGGAKGQARPLSAREVVEAARDILSIEPRFVINEYGMTELCSQLYDATALNSDRDVPPEERMKIAPPWMMPMAIDPITMRRLPEGETGLLGFIDLANVHSVSAVLTEDVGMVFGNRVRMLGRARAGGARGCALSIDQFARLGARAAAPRSA